MDSDDDMVDAYYDEESEEYNTSSDRDDDDEHGHGDEHESDCDYIEEEDDSSTHCSQVNHVVLKEEEIRKRQEDDIKQVSTVLSITNVEASVLLLHYRWNLSKLNDEWFADEEKVRKTVGVLEREESVVVDNPRKVKCGICFEKFRRVMIVPVVCGHTFCSTCWNGYISTAINDGSGCLTRKCPEPSCHVAVGRDMVEKVVSEEDKEKYNRYFLRSYIEESRKMKWCPAPGCEHAVEFSASGTGVSSDVSCSCSHSFCWRCKEDAHSPLDCGTVSQWILKNSAEAENTQWILANSKACPKCQRPIEKNQGCMHMTCGSPCRHEFCWLCLGSWKEHNEHTGGHYSCNKYEKARKEGVYDEADRKREMAKNSLERYTHYFERWASNEKSRKKAFGDLQMFLLERIATLSGIQCVPETQLTFITDAWRQIIECRRVLKWTYAYGYYLAESEHEKRRFFEYVQGEAESGLERLHKCVETESEVFQNGEVPKEREFNAFREKLTNLTRVTKTHFETLVNALENGLSEVESQAACSKETESFKREKKKQRKGGSER